MTHRIKIAGGLTVSWMFIKVLGLMIGEDMLMQWLGSEYGLGIELTIFTVIFVLIIWYIMNGKKR